MVLHKQVNGIRIQLSAEEEAKVRAKWAKNDAKREKEQELEDLMKQVPSIEDRLYAIEKYIVGLDPKDENLIKIKKYADLSPIIKEKKEANRNG